MGFQAVKSTQREWQELWFSGCRGARGGCQSLLSPLARSTTHHRRCRAMHLRTRSSKGAFLLTALLESNCATPARFCGSKPSLVSAFSAACWTHAHPPLQSHFGLSQWPGFCLFSDSGGSFHALGTLSPQKHTTHCAFLLLYIILRFEIHLVRNMQHYQLVIVAV